MEELRKVMGITQGYAHLLPDLKNKAGFDRVINQEDPLKVNSKDVRKEEQRL